MLGIGKEMIQNISDGVHSDCGKPEKTPKPPYNSAPSSMNRGSASGTSPPNIQNEEGNLIKMSDVSLGTASIMH